MSGDKAVATQGYTHIAVQEISYRWTIHNFSYCLEGMPDPIFSGTFSSGANDNLKWCLRVHPKGIDIESKDYVSVYLVLLRSPKTPVWAKFQFCIINAEGDKTLGMSSPRVFKFLPGDNWGLKMFVLQDFLLALAEDLPENNLTLLCNVTMARDTYSISEEDWTQAIKVPRCTLTADLGELWETSRLTDCSLLVDGHEFHVTEHQIKIWFKNKQARQNQKKLEKLPGNHDGKQDHVSCDRPACPSSVPLGKQGQASCDLSASTKGTGIPLASVCEDSVSQKQSISTNSLPLTPSSMSLDSESISSLGEKSTRVSSPPPFHPSMFPDPESIFSPDENNMTLAWETLMFAQSRQSTGTGDRIPDLSAACPSSEHPATARIPASVQPSYFCTASSAFSATDTSAAGNPTKTPSVNTAKLTELVQDDTFIKDQQFLKELSDLEAAEVALSPPDIMDSFSLSDFF